MNINYLNWCRLCASSSENSVPIFEEDGISNFAEKIKSYLHIEIPNTNNVNDAPRMCNSCSEKIINWDHYVERVQKVQGMFMSLKTMDDNGELLKKFNEEVMTTKGKNDNSKDIDSIQFNRKEKSECAKKTGKQRRGKKVKEVVPVLCNDDDFSEEDDLPLALQVDCSSDPKNNLENDAGTNAENGDSENRIKLKIKAVKDKYLEVINDEEEGAEKGEEEAKNRSNDEGNNSSDSKTGSRLKKSGLQQLFTWECLECQAPVKNWSALVKHCKEAHESNAAVLCICGKQLQSRASIMKHRMKHTVGYGYKCDYENCNKTFHRQQLLDVHMLSHMPKELQPWMCCKCSRRFHTESLLKQHEKVHLPKEEKLIHPCEVCHKRFCSKSAVAAHIRAVHFGERPFVCDQCGHSFTSKGILHEHLTIHSDVYNYHCKDCKKSFKTKYRLKIHMDTHVETSYQCPICTLTLNTRRTLRMHLLVHQDDKAFQCTTCGKAFKRSKDLKNHYNLHTGRRPYTCPFCLRTFANGSNCRSHKRRMHPEELRMYEAALAAGQQPHTLQAEEPKDTTQEPEMNPEELLDDSNDSEGSEGAQRYSDETQRFSDEAQRLSDETQRYSDEAQRYSDEAQRYSDEEEKPGESNLCFDEKFMSGTALNFENNCLKIKEEEDEDVANDFAMEVDENAPSNIGQIVFGNQSQSLHYPIHGFYTFQSSGIPAFPGNPFFRQ